MSSSIDLPGNPTSSTPVLFAIIQVTLSCAPCIDYSGKLNELPSSTSCANI